MQNTLFYIVSDDADWTRKNLENSSSNIFFIGAHRKDNMSREQFDEENNIGKLHQKANIALQLIFIVNSSTKFEFDYFHFYLGNTGLITEFSKNSSMILRHP